jgi:hypothetical protein
MSLNKQWVTAAVLLVVTISGTATFAQTGAAPSDTAGVLVAPESDTAPAMPATPLGREVAGIRDRFRTRLAELTAVYAVAPDAAAAAAAQHEIAALKLQLEIDLLSLQLRLARERNEPDAIAELDQSLTAARTRLVADTGLDAPAVPAATSK